MYTKLNWEELSSKIRKIASLSADESRTYDALQLVEMCDRGSSKSEIQQQLFDANAILNERIYALYDSLEKMFFESPPTDSQPDNEWSHLNAILEQHDALLDEAISEARARSRAFHQQQALKVSKT